MEMKTARGKIIKELVRDFEGTVAQDNYVKAKSIYEEILIKVAEMENEILKYNAMEEQMGYIREVQYCIDTLRKVKRYFADIHLEECLQSNDDFNNLLPTLLRTIKENELPVNVICYGIEYTYNGEYYLLNDTAYYGEVVVYLGGDFGERYYFTERRYDIDDDIERLEDKLNEKVWFLNKMRNEVYPDGVYPDWEYDKAYRRLQW